MLTFSVLTAQNKQFTLQEIWGGEFSSSRIYALNAMNDGQHYTVFNFDAATKNTSVDKYSYQTLKKITTLVSASDISEISDFTNYTFNADETKILLATDVASIFRHSSVGKYFIYNIKTKKTTLLIDKKIQEPTFSPDGNNVAYVFENNIYYKNLTTNKETQVTFDGEKGKIINGVTDWVYEEEFAFVRAFDWNKTGTILAFLRFNETDVPEFSMDIYGKNLYPHQKRIKYPKAGEKNAIVSLYIHTLSTNALEKIPLGEYEYIPRIKWTNTANKLSVITLNRHQNNLKIQLVNSTTKTVKTILHETDSAYIDITDNLTFLKDDSFIWTSEKDGNNHIYHYSKKGKLITQVTKGDWEITNYYGFNENNGKIYYQSTENGSINRTIYSVLINGKKKKRISKKTGTNNADFSADFSYYINTFSNSTTPSEYTLNDASCGKVLKKIKDNKTLQQKLAQYNYSSKEFSTIRINENDLNMWIIKPANFDSKKQYPLLLYQYSGPGSQQVANKWNSINDYWYYMLAQQGYIIACVDGRGTGFKGAKFKKCTQKELGKFELADQIAIAKKLGNEKYIDANRIGIWGWSYGGFMSANCLFQAAETFKMAIAVAPVTSWRFYDSIYTERYMQTPQENATGYDQNSPITHVNKLKGNFLLIHGSGDDNVHVQNTMRMVKALIQADKQFEWMIYPDKNHGIYGGNTRLHLYKKMTKFIKENL